MIRVLLVDDHRILRASLERLLDAEEDMEVVGTSGDGGDAVSLVSAERPDVVLMDLSMPAMDGVEATRRIVGLDLGAHVVVGPTARRRTGPGVRPVSAARIRRRPGDRPRPGPRPRRRRAPR